MNGSKPILNAHTPCGDEEAAPSEPDDPLGRPGGVGEHVTVELALETADLDPPLAGWIEPRLARAATALGVGVAELTVLAVDDARMAELHEQHTGVAGTTDVLTFDLGGGPGDAAVCGDIVLCLHVAQREAAGRGHDGRVEALLYAVHGLLHLLGEDDRSADQARRMHQREDEVLAAIGVGPVYGAARREGER